jgi:hypothetical protein
MDKEKHTLLEQFQEFTSYQYAVLSFIKVCNEGNSADYESDKSRIKKSYKSLIDGYKNQ